MVARTIPFSVMDPREIGRKCEGRASIGYRLWVRIASNWPIPARIRIGHERARSKI
jgi:hypothetical protein